MCDKRLGFILFIVIILTGIISWRLFSLQVVDGGMWRAQAQGQQRLFEQTQGERGDIYFVGKGGVPIPVAVNKAIYHAYISPRELSRREESIEYLAKNFAELLEIEEEFVLERIQRDSGYEILKRRLEPDDMEKVRAIEGIHLSREIIRDYPEKELGSHIIGFLGGEGIGQYGVEQYYEDIIGGKQGIREGLKSGWGSFITRDSTQRGEDVFLTIDYNIQHFTERTLKGAVERVGAVSGSVLVGNPMTGEILAIANYPFFDPNEYGKFDISHYRNVAIQETFEPGSVFKPVTMVAALNEEAVVPEDTYQDIGHVRIHGRVIHNYNRRSYGLVTMTEIMERSINTGIVHVKDQLGNEPFLEYLQRFGFFEPTGIDLHGEVYSPNRIFLEGHDANFATASYGHGIEVNSAQLFRAFSVMANGGYVVDPHVVKRDNPTIGEEIVSAKAASLVTEMMVSTIERGFGRSAKVPGYHIAGKTGTATIPWSKLGISRAGYSNKTIQGFIGYAPAFNPEFVIVVRLDQPHTRSAEESAAPVFREIAEYILQYKGVPHDYNEESEKEKND